MKPRDVQRSVKSTRFDRSAGDAPSIGRVSRMPGVGRSKGVRRKRRISAGGRGERRRKRQRVMMMWSIGLVMMAACVMAAAVWFWTAGNMNRNRGQPQTHVDEAREKVKSRFPSPSRDVALDFVKRALEIRTKEEVAEYFRPDGRDPNEVLGFLAGRKQSDGTIEQFLWISSVDANGLLVDGVEIYSKKGERAVYRLALLTPDENGRWRMDFGALARPMNPSWEDLMNGRADDAVVRVLIRVDHYFNGNYRDEGKWSCFSLNPVDVEGTLYGYCERNSPQEKALGKILMSTEMDGDGPPTRRATLKITRKAGADRSQFQIEGVVAEDWIVSDKTFDGNFR